MANTNFPGPDLGKLALGTETVGGEVLPRFVLMDGAATPTISNLPAAEYYTQIRRGLITGQSMVAIIGHDDAVTTTKTTISPTLTTLNIDQSDLDATPATVDVASSNVNDTSAGSGMRTCTLSGLNSSGVAQSETITLNGQTEVTSSNTYSAVLGLRGLTWGAGKLNAGEIWCGNGTFTAGVPATKYFTIETGLNKATTAYYVVPAANTFYAEKISLFLGSAGKDVKLFLESSTDGVNFITEDPFEIESGSEYHGDIIALPGFVAGTHIRVEGISSAATTSVTVTLAGVLIAD